MQKIFWFLLLNCVMPLAMAIVMGLLWERIILKIILKNKWGDELANEYFRFKKDETVKNHTLHDSRTFCTRGLFNENLPEDMLNHLSKVETISGIFQYFILGVLISFGYLTYSIYFFGYSISVPDILLISLIDFVLFSCFGMPWLPVFFSLIVFFITCMAAKMAGF